MQLDCKMNSEKGNTASWRNVRECRLGCLNLGRRRYQEGSKSRQALVRNYEGVSFEMVWPMQDEKSAHADNIGRGETDVKGRDDPVGDTGGRGGGGFLSLVGLECVYNTASLDKPETTRLPLAFG